MRFKQGELAIVAVAVNMHHARGKIVEILRVGPFHAGDLVTVPELQCTIHMRKDCHYISSLYDDDDVFTPNDWQLQKLEPPAEPKSLTRSEYSEA